MVTYTARKKLASLKSDLSNNIMSEEEYIDTNFEWSFLELTERMQHLLKEDRHSYIKAHQPRKSMFYNLNRVVETSGSQRFSKDSDNITVNVLGILPKQSISSDEPQRLLKEDMDKWSFDIFSLSYITNGHPLKILALELFARHDLFNAFHLTEEILLNFIIRVERHYRLSPYHNACHAADVLQTVNCIICKTGFLCIMSKLEIFCLLLTAIVHDVEHTGTNNNFHKNSGSDLAKLYVVSVLENHHIRVGLRLVQEHELLRSLSPDQYEEFQYMLVTMILATDMANHFLLITNMRLMLSMPTKCRNRMRMKRVLLMLLHCADISNPAKPWDIHKSWVSLLIEEFFLQGDKEREMKLPITPNCDRNTANIATLQIGFMQTFSKDTFVITDQLIEMELIGAGRPYVRYTPWHACMEENMAKWNGKWKFLKYEQINELLAETAKPRLSMAIPSSSYNSADQTTCFCCRCLKKRSFDSGSACVIGLGSNF